MTYRYQVPDCCVDLGYICSPLIAGTYYRAIAKHDTVVAEDFLPHAVKYPNMLKKAKNPKEVCELWGVSLFKDVKILRAKQADLPNMPSYIASAELNEADGTIDKTNPTSSHTNWYPYDNIIPEQKFHPYSTNLDDTSE